MSDYFYDAVVREVIDGDTVRLDVDLGFRHWQHDMVIRLFGVNAPEKSTPAGKLAKQWLQGYLPVGSRVVLESIKDKADKYGGRWLGKISRFPSDTRTANEELLYAGHGLPWDGKGIKPV